VTDRRPLLDAGPLVALFNAKDRHHRLCVETFDSLPAPLLTCWPVLTEAAWLLRRLPRPLDQIAAAHDAGVFKILSLDGDCLAEIAAIMRRYKDIGLQLADAALVYLAERENIRTVFTLDRRNSSIVRLKRNRVLKLIPELP